MDRTRSTGFPAGELLVPLPDGGGVMHTRVDGGSDDTDGADVPVLLLVHGTGGCVEWWEPLVPGLAAAHRVIRVDLLGHGRSSEPPEPADYGIPAQARRIGAALDELGVRGPVVVVGHSTGGSVATSLAEQRPELVGALALVNSGPSPEAVVPQAGALARVFTTPLTGRPLWRLLRRPIVRRALADAVTRPVALPEPILAATRAMSYRAVVGTSDAALAYLVERPLPARLVALEAQLRRPLPLLVVFGAADRRWYSSVAAEEYRAVPGARVELLPGVGHSPMLEEPERTLQLLLDFAAAHPHQHAQAATPALPPPTPSARPRRSPR